MAGLAKGDRNRIDPLAPPEETPAASHDVVFRDDQVSAAAGGAVSDESVTNEALGDASSGAEAAVGDAGADLGVAGEASPKNASAWPEGDEDLSDWLADPLPTADEPALNSVIPARRGAETELWPEAATDLPSDESFTDANFAEQGTKPTEPASIDADLSTLAPEITVAETTAAAPPVPQATGTELKRPETIGSEFINSETNGMKSVRPEPIGSVTSEPEPSQREISSPVPREPQAASPGDAALLGFVPSKPDVAEGFSEPADEKRGFFKRRRLQRKHRPRLGLRLVLVLVLLALVLGLCGMALTGRSFGLPVWAVAEVENRLNSVLRSNEHIPQGAAVSLGDIEIALDRDFSPRFRLRDLRLIEPSGQSILALPELAVALDPGALLRGQARLSSVKLLGAQLTAVRDAEGRIGLSIGGISGAKNPQSLAEMLDALDRMFSTPTLAGLHLIEAEALTLTLTDARAGRAWQLGDGRLILENRAEGLAAELGLTLLDGANPAQARMVIETEKATSAARILANLDGMAAADLAAQAPALAVLGALDAPISGRMIGELGADGQLKGFEGALSLGAGAFRPAPDATPVGFDRAEMALRYDPARQKVTLGSLRVESPSLRLRARGSAELQDGKGGLARPGQIPADVVGQLTFSEVMVDPEGLFVEPVQFDTGALAVRVSLNPFRAEIGELSLGEGDGQLRLTGDLATGKGGWEGAVDVSLQRIDADRLLKLWPVSVVPKTRNWLATNIGQGEFRDFDASLRLQPGQEPRFALDYNFDGAEVRFIRTLPPVKDGTGRSTIFGNAYTVVLESGHVTAPGGGMVDAAGSVMVVPDITKMPATAEVTLNTRSTLTAALSLLDQEPFRFLTKAGRPVDLGEGTAEIQSTLNFPLKGKIGVTDVSYNVTGVVKDFRSTVLVPGKELSLPVMAVKVTPDGMALSGKGKLDSLPFDATFDQRFGPDAGGKATASAKVWLTDERLRQFGIALPQGWLSGETQAEVDMVIPKGAPLTLVLSSSLTGAGLKVPPLGWTKAAKTKASLKLSAKLGPRPEVTSLRLDAPGLLAEGSLTTTEDGSLDRARFSKVEAGDWLQAAVDLVGRGKNRSPSVEVHSGRLSLPQMPKSAGGDAGGGDSTEMSVALDRLVVSSGVALTDFRGRFKTTGGGLQGKFSAAVNGRGGVEGSVVPDRGRTAVRIASGNAGTVMAAAGFFKNGRGGSLDLTLSPRGPEGQYVGNATFKNLSVQEAPSLAALLSAISVVGLLEQMQGQGLVFDEGDVEFVLNPDGVQITKGAAVGASLGISFEGAYSSGSEKLDLQGVISPIYILNGIGKIFAPRKGEGLFGFNYRLSGKVEDLSVSVNPLSLLTPGMFREIFHRPAPVVRKSSGG